MIDNLDTLETIADQNDKHGNVVELKRNLPKGARQFQFRTAASWKRRFHVMLATAPKSYPYLSKKESQ